MGLENAGDFEEDYSNLTGYDSSSLKTLIVNRYDLVGRAWQHTREWKESEWGSMMPEPCDYKNSLIEQILGLSPRYFIRWFEHNRVFGDELLEMAEYAASTLTTTDLEDKLDELCEEIGLYDYQDGGELEDQDGEVSVPEGMEQWAGTRVVTPRAPGRFDNVLESTDETTRLERERIAARQQLNNI